MMSTNGRNDSHISNTLMYNEKQGQPGRFNSRQISADSRSKDNSTIMTSRENDTMKQRLLPGLGNQDIGSGVQQ